MVDYYPLFLKVHNKKCVVVGGGEVAERKVESLVEGGARVTVISPTLTPGLRRRAEEGSVKVVPRPYQRGDLAEALLVIAATDDAQVNRGVAAEARKRGILVNVVDAPRLSSFIVPSVVRRGNLQVAISTGGRSPALAKRLREELERSFPPEYASLVRLAGQVRRQLRRKSARSRARD